MADTEMPDSRVLGNLLLEIKHLFKRKFFGRFLFPDEQSMQGNSWLVFLELNSYKIGKYFRHKYGYQKSFWDKKISRFLSLKYDFDGLISRLTILEDGNAESRYPCI